MSAPLFSKRHYEWLARWAGANLTHEQTFALSCDLATTDPERLYKHEIFMKRSRIWREQFARERDEAVSL